MMAKVKQKQSRVAGLALAVDIELGLVKGHNECVAAFVFIDPDVPPYYEDFSNVEFLVHEPKERPEGNMYDIVGLFEWQLQLCQCEEQPGKLYADSARDLKRGLEKTIKGLQELLEEVNTSRLWSETEDYGNGPNDIPGHRD